ncbi:MAG: DUF4339 domain-containing protein [Hyphomonadaceae bacterium]|nr:DUF4339 domain-containing protein [Hyphomonadaceae bacterium]GIK48694.1 MAG: hypothetical protein BroJett013_13910 [Alphaproteobacteria bacterium]
MNHAVPMASPAARQWWVQVRGKAYGPYSMTQLSAFVTEGRVRPATQVSNAPDGAWVEARKVIGLMNHACPGAPANDSAEAANVFVHVEIFSGSWMSFMAALESMGHVCELSPGLYLVRTRFSAGVIRNTLSQTLERGDRFVVVDASRDRLAWFNLGPEIDVRISKVWNGPLRAETR